MFFALESYLNHLLIQLLKNLSHRLSSMLKHQSLYFYPQKEFSFASHFSQSLSRRKMLRLLHTKLIIQQAPLSLLVPLHKWNREVSFLIDDTSPSRSLEDNVMES